MQEALPGLSEGARTSLVEAKRVKVHHRVKARLTDTVLARGLVAIRLPAVDGHPVVPEDLPVEVLAEDGHMLVVNKPPGVISHPSLERKSNTLINWVLYR